MPPYHTQYGCTYPARVYHTQYCAHYRVNVTGLMSPLLASLRERGTRGAQRPLSLLRINPPQPGNREVRAKKPGTESPRAQGRAEYSNPSGSDGKPPSRSWPALPVMKGREIYPLPGPTFLTKSVKMVKTGREEGHPTVKREKGRPCTFCPFYTFCQ